MLSLLLLPAALAATPTPDRPSFSRTGWLVAPGTLEVEAGATWGTEGRAFPALLKYSVAGVVEPRLGMNLAGFDGASPALEAGVKVRLVGTDALGLAIYGGSAIPLEGEAWRGQLHGLLSARLERSLVLQVESGVDLAGGPVRVASIPVSALLRGTTGRLSLFGEGAAWVAGDVRFAVDGGAGLRVTEILVVDGAVGWDFAAEAPFAKVGLTGNLGRP